MPYQPTYIADPLRLHIIKELCDALRTITPSNGYALDFSGAEGTENNRVYRGRAVFGSSDALPCLSVLEAPIPLDQLPAPYGSVDSSGPWELVIQGFFHDDKYTPCDAAYVGLADVKRLLAIERKKVQGPSGQDSVFDIGRAVPDIQIGQGVVRPPDEISATAYFWLTIALTVVEDLETPYQF